MICLRALGAFDLRNSGGQELRPVLAQPKRAALLAYLALAQPRGPHRRDTLLALFWPEQDVEHARNALSQAVHFLRRSLGAEALVGANGDGLRLEWKDFWCDAVGFEEALEAGRSAEALELYRGDLLEGFHIADAPEFERWLEAERTRLAQRYANAVEAVAEEREAAGDYENALRLWRRLASRDLYNSRVALRLMRALAAGGDPGGAIQHARVHETLLRDDLDVAPAAEIAALVRQLQALPRESPVVQQPPSASPATTPPAQQDPVEASASSGGTPGARRLPQRRVAVIACLATLFAAGGSIVTLRMGAREPSIPEIRSLAVLPLVNLSADSAQDRFADGMHDALIGELARYPDLTVISRTSTVQYKATRKRLPDIARELKVQAVLEGTVLRQGERVRVNVQLLDGSSDRHLWAKSYERDLRDILLLQSELAQAIAREVNVAAKPTDPRPGSALSPADSAPRELYLRELYLRGLHAQLGLSLAGVQAAKAYFQQTIQRDSNFALGYAGLAGVYGIMADYDFARVGPALDSARIMARRAVALDSTLPETRTAMAMMLGDAGEFGAAEREFKRAIELGPSNAGAHYGYSILLVGLGRGTDALREAQRAAQLDPFGPRGQLVMQRYATYLLTGERPYLKLPVAQRRPILKVEPGEPWARAREGVEFAQEGKCAEARAEILRAQQLVQADNRRMLQHVAMVYWFCGDRGRARSILGAMKRRPDAPEHGARVAVLYALFGQRDSAFAWLEHHRWTLSQLTGLSAGPPMDPLRSDPRFARLQRRLGVRPL